LARFSSKKKRGVESLEIQITRAVSMESFCRGKDVKEEAKELSEPKK